MARTVQEDRPLLGENSFENADILPERRKHVFDPQQAFIKLQASPGDTNLINALIEHYLPIVEIYADRLIKKLPKKVEIQDLVQAGFFGLREAVIAYRPGDGVKFESYCPLRIQGSMLDSLRKADCTPRLVRVEQRKIESTRRRLWHELQREPNQADLAEAVLSELPAEGASETMRELLVQGAPRQFTSLFARVGKDSSTHQEGTVFDSFAPEDNRFKEPSSAVTDLDTRGALLRGLNESERILYQLYVVDGLPMGEVADRLGLSESRISQMFSGIVVLLQERIRTETLRKAKTELALIGERMRVLQDMPSEKDYSEISSEVMSYLDRLNSSGTVNFYWQESSEEYELADGADADIKKLVDQIRQDREESAEITGNKNDLLSDNPQQITSEKNPEIDPFGFTFTDFDGK